jgi:hypothetical protein
MSPQGFLVALLALGGLLAAPEAVQAQDAASEGVVVPSPPVMPPGEDVITELAPGDRAPHEGMLLDTDTAIRWTFRLEWYRNELGLTLRAHRRELAAIEGSAERRLRLQEESYLREIEGLRGDLRAQAAAFATAQGQPWYDTFLFGSIVGVVFTVVLAALIVWGTTSL